MPKVRSKKLVGLIIPFFLAACMIAGYWFYWSKIAREVENQVQGALRDGGAASVKVTGFPYRLTLEITDLKVGTQNGSAFSSSSLIATATPFNPMLWILEGTRDPAMALPGGATQPLKATNLKASVRFATTGLQRFSVTFDGLEAQDVAQDGGGWRIGKGLFHLMSRFEDDASLAMVVELSDVRIAKSLEGPGAILGQTINRIFVSGPIDQRIALMKSLRDWQLAEGKFTIMAGEIIWGPISLTAAKGVMSLTAANKWQGTLDGQGALKPEGIAVSGLSGPVSLQIQEGRLSLRGLPGIDLSDAFQ